MNNTYNETTLDDVDGISGLSVVNTFIAIIGIVGLIGNFAVCYVFLKVKHLRTLTNYLIVHQAVIDFMASVIIALIVLGPQFNSVAETPLGRFVCLFWKSAYPQWALFLTSSLNLVVITMERYCAIVYPLHYSRLFTVTKVKIMLVMVWVIGFAFKSFLFSIQHYDHGQCLFQKTWPSVEVARAVGILNVLVHYFTPLAVMAFAYMRCIMVLMKSSVADVQPSQSSMANKLEHTMQKVRKNVLKMLLLVFVAYAVCWGPNQVMFALFCVGVKIDFLRGYYQFTSILGLLNSAINPFIYALKYKQFQNGIRIVFGCKKAAAIGDINSIHSVDMSINIRTRNTTVN
ncbi:substance-P receptor-like [Saccoglossus kowalevskii]|uniref:Substance-P receptor-like n=1 Tax=Saccoglossus kowalevskii TaxID=10224 RepID=A0ABM0M0T9_SACKO|nr:PREDICTED: substance-P receptor-like [Saccoglossus kowalevskii]